MANITFIDFETIANAEWLNEVNRKSRGFSDVAEVRATEGLFHGQQTELLGYNTGSDGGSLRLFWDSVSVAADNGSTTFKVTGIVTGRWRALIAQQNYYPVVIASGTVDVIIATYPSPVGFINGVELRLQASGANISSAPTFSPNGLAAKSIVKYGNFPLVSGDIASASHTLILKYSSANDNWELLNPSQSIKGYAKIRDVKSLGVDGGTFTQGAWQTRTLNVIETDTGDITLSSNQITLQPGTYSILAFAPGHDVVRHQARLYNITSAAQAIAGTNEYSSAGGDDGTTRSIIMGQFSVSVVSVLEIQHRCQTTTVTVGFGAACSFTNEIYTELELTRIK